MTPTVTHRMRNWLHTAVLLGGMALLAWVCTSALLGPRAAVWAMLGGALAMALTPAAPKELVLRLAGARPVAPWRFPAGAEILRALAARAGLPRAPALYIVPSATPNAFAVGSPRNGAVVVTDGLLRLLDRRELAGVLAHEISHIANRDLGVMALANLLTRVTGVFAVAGQMLLFFNLPLALMGAPVVPWVVPLVLIFAPLAMLLMQLALSRAREFEADIGAARLTGDPLGLASALAALDRRSFSFWRLLFPVGGDQAGPLLRTHPATRDRIARLSAMARGAIGAGRVADLGGRPGPWDRPIPRRLVRGVQ